MAKVVEWTVLTGRGSLRIGGHVAPRGAHETEGPARSGEALEVDVRLRVSGELAGAGVRSFENAIRAALQASAREIVVDLTGVDRIDETGLTALLKAHLRSRRHGLPIKFEPSDHQAVKQLVAVTGSEEISD